MDEHVTRPINQNRSDPFTNIPEGEVIFKVAEQFSRFPGGRKKIHGQFSGEEFRESYSLPLLKAHKFVTFDLTGSAGYSSGFLDAAFGELGMIFSLAELQERLKIISEDDPDAVHIAWNRIEHHAHARLFS